MTTAPTPHPTATDAGVTRFRGVVVGDDGSPASHAAIGWVARQAPVSVQLVRAISPGLELLEAGFQLDSTPMHQRAADELERAAMALPPEIEVTSHLIDDSPSKALVDTAHRSEADAIVIGINGHERFGSIVGANVGRLLHLSDVPVIVVPEAAGETGRRSDGPPLVVVGSDDPAELRDLIAWATHCIVAGVEVEAVLTLSPTLLAIPDTADLALEIERHARARLVTTLPADFTGTRDVVFHHPVTALADASERAELVVVPSRRHARMRGFLVGSIAHHLPTMTHCPVAIVPVGTTTTTSG